jgi:acyl-CoA dehydrogenase-like protein
MGIAGATPDAFVELERDKIPRGAKRTLRDNNVVQSPVAQAEAKLGAARAFLVTRSRSRAAGSPSTSG